MNWKTIVVGAFMTLIVTIIGGVVVYFITREPPPTPAAEKLVFQSDKTISFESPKTKITILTVRVSNIGTLEARNVRVALDYGERGSIIDRKISLTTEPVGRFEEERTEGSETRIDLKVPVMVPREILTITAVLDGVVEDSPRVGSSIWPKSTLKPSCRKIG